MAAVTGLAVGPMVMAAVEASERVMATAVAAMTMGVAAMAMAMGVAAMRVAAMEVAAMAMGLREETAVMASPEAVRDRGRSAYQRCHRCSYRSCHHQS